MSSGTLCLSLFLLFFCLSSARLLTGLFSDDNDKRYLKHKNHVTDAGDDINNNNDFICIIHKVCNIK